MADQPLRPTERPFGGAIRGYAGSVQASGRSERLTLRTSHRARLFRSGAESSAWPDVVLALCLLSTLVLGGLYWTMQPSWPRDLLAVSVLVLAALAGGSRYKGLRGPWIAAWSLVGMGVFGLYRWIAEIGSSLGLNFWTGWSPWLPSLAFLVFALVYGRSRWLAWRTLFIWAALTVGVIQLVGLLAVMAGVVSVGGEPSPEGAFYGMRPIQASLALVMVLGFSLLVTSPAEQAMRYSVPAACFLGVSVILSQHRSVWVAMLLVCLLLLLAGVRRGDLSETVTIPIAVTMGYTALAALVPVVSHWSVLPRISVEQLASNRVPDVMASTHTTQWRLDMWESSLSAPRTFVNWLFGGVFGVNPVKWPGEGVMNPLITSHNMAIDVIVMLGVVGLVLIGYIFIAATMLRADRLAPESVFLWSLLVYGVFYPWPAWAWVILGAAVSVAVPRPRTQDKCPESNASIAFRSAEPHPHPPSTAPTPAPESAPSTPRRSMP